MIASNERKGQMMAKKMLSSEEVTELLFDLARTRELSAQVAQRADQLQRDYDDCEKELKILDKKILGLWKDLHRVITQLMPEERNSDAIAEVPTRGV